MPARENNFSNFLKRKGNTVCVRTFQFFIKDSHSFFGAQFFTDFHAVPVRENFPSFQGDPHDLAPDVLPRASAVNEHESAYCNTIELLNNNS